MNAIYNTTFSGPVAVKILYLVDDTFVHTLMARVRVTVKNHRTYPLGLELDVPLYDLYKKHRFVGYRSLYEGRPDWSKITKLETV